MSRYDATQSNESKRSAKIYRDLDLDFQANSATKDIQKLSDVEAVKRSVRNLINTNHYERPFHPEIGSNLRAMLFENITPQMTHALSKQIDLLLKNFEPRIEVLNTNIQARADANEVNITVTGRVKSSNEIIDITTTIERLR